MERTDPPIADWLNQTSTDPAGGALAVLVRRLRTEATTVIPAKRRSVSIVVRQSGLVGYPLLNGVPLAAGDSFEFRSDYPGFGLPSMYIDTVVEDDVLVVETWVVVEAPGGPPPPPPTSSALLLEDGGYLLLEDGSHLLLEP